MSDCRLISVLNMKGGVGKTTLSVNLSRYLARIGNRVLLIDLDPQSNATIVCMDADERGKHQKSITDFFISIYEPRVNCTPTPREAITVNNLKFSVKLTDVPEASKSGRLDFIRSDLWLSSVLRGVPIGPHTLDLIINDDVKKDYDFIFIDCAPTHSLLTSIALNTTKSVLIPMIPDEFGRHGTDLMKIVIREHLHDYDVKVGIVGVVFTMINPNKRDKDITEEGEIIASWPKTAVFTESINRDDWYRDLHSDRKYLDSNPESVRAKAEFEKFVASFLEKSKNLTYLDPSANE